VVLGEVGLSGELRPVAQLEKRLREASKLGFKCALVPRGAGLPTDRGVGLHVMTAASLREAAAQAGL
jgi:DNA repair protein RadA/Sms